jgi:hypothetical protein
MRSENPPCSSIFTKIQDYFSKKNEGKEITIIRIPREDSNQAYLLFKLASSNLVELYLDVWIKTLKKPSVGEEGLMTAPITLDKD